MDDYTVDEQTFGDNLRVRVVYDQDGSSSNPRDWFNITTIRGWHRRFDIGDGPNIDSERYDDLDHMLADVIEDAGPVVMVAPLLWHEHSGVTCAMGTPFSPTVTDEKHSIRFDAADLARFRSQVMDDGGWDSGVAGIVFVTEKALAEAGTDLADVEQVARQEVETYAAWLCGEVYGYVVELDTICDHDEIHTDVLDSCWGFVGESEYALSEGVASVGWHVVQILRQAMSGAAPWDTGRSG